MPVQRVALGKRERLAHKCFEPLSQGVVPALYMRCLPCSFSRPDMLRCRKYGLVRLPQICVAGSLTPQRWYLLPQITVRLFAAVAQAAGATCRVSRSSAARTQAGSAFERTNDQSSSNSKTGTVPSWGGNTVLKDGRAATFFSQLVTVLRDTPKAHVRPRRLERS